jgi:hypothetical protein
MSLTWARFGRQGFARTRRVTLSATSNGLRILAFLIRLKLDDSLEPPARVGDD